MNFLQNNYDCRICLRHDLLDSHKCLSLFEVYNGSSISEKIYSIVNVKINKDDGFPHKICPDCLLQLETAVQFKVKCETANEILLNSVFLQKQTKLEAKKAKSENKLVKKETIEIEVENNFDLLHYTDTEYLEAESDLDSKEDITSLDARPSRAIDLKLICDDCGGSFKSKCKLRVHWKKVHLPQKLICNRCKRMFKSYKAYNLHIKTGNKNCNNASNSHIEGQGKSRIFHCKECDYKTKRIRDLDTHFMKHTGVRRFECKECSKTFTQQSSLQAHRESTHKEFKIDTTCVLCGKRLQGRGKFYKHMRRHKDERVQCTICNKTVINKNYLINNHMPRHGNVKSFTCDICAAAFYTSVELYNHRTKVHLKTKFFKCDLCEYKVWTKASLNKHKSKHSGTNVCCMECGQFSENAIKLAIHQRCHFNKIIPCTHTQCDKMFHNKRALSKHTTKYHRCTLLVEKREEQVNSPELKQESPIADEDNIIISHSPTVLTVTL